MPELEVEGKARCEYEEECYMSDTIDNYLFNIGYYNIYPGLATGAASCATAGSAATTTATCPPAGCHGPAETESRESRAQPRQMTGYFNK